MKVYLAINSYPDSPISSVISVHRTWEGAVKAIDKDFRYIDSFRKQVNKDRNEWIGPDGFGSIKLMDVKE